MDCSPTGSSVYRIPREEYWSQLLFPPPGDLPNSGIKPMSLCLLHWQADALPLSHLGSPSIYLQTHRDTHTHRHTHTQTHTDTQRHTQIYTHTHTRLGGANMAGTWMDSEPYLLPRWKARTLVNEDNRKGKWHWNERKPWAPPRGTCLVITIVARNLKIQFF